MSREIRRVPANWEHPRDKDGHFVALLRSQMPKWPESIKTHIQMYETTTEGTPLSPVMESPEKLARWLADNGVSAFANFTAPYEHWLRVCRGGWGGPVLEISRGGIKSGVEAMSRSPLSDEEESEEDEDEGVGL